MNHSRMKRLSLVVMLGILTIGMIQPTTTGEPNKFEQARAEGNQIDAFEPQSPSNGEFPNDMVVRPENPPQKVASTQAYIEREPILITSDSDLNDSAVTGFKGNGTIDDPILIEGYNITDSSDTLVGLIDIRSTTYYFRIVNCLINGLGTIGNGIYFDNVIHGTIVNNTILNNGWTGVNVARRSDFNIVANNTIYNNSEDGIRLGEATPSHHNILSNNTIYNNSWRGIAVEASVNNTIEYNTIYKSGGNAIDVHSSSNLTKIDHNIIYDNGGGISGQYSLHLIVENNSISNNGNAGIGFDKCENSTIVNNTVSGQHPSGGINLGFSANSTISQNTVFNVEAWAGIAINPGSDNCSVINNRVYSNWGNGIVIDNADNIEVCNNTAFDNNYPGIRLDTTNNTYIFNNSVYLNKESGIWLFEYSYRSEIVNNTVYKNGDGIFLLKSDDNIVSHNTVYDHNGGGVILDDSHNNRIDVNTISTSKTDFSGISLGNSHENVIQDNTIFQNQLPSDNGQTGVHLSMSSNNIIHNNIIYNIGFAAIQIGGTGNAYNLISQNKLFNSGHGIIINSDLNNISSNEIYNNNANLYIDGNRNNIINNVIYDSYEKNIYLFGNNNLIQMNDFFINVGGIHDDETDNTFLNNYWSDWSGVGVYSTPGNQDPSPLMNPFHLSAPSITAPTGTTPTLKDSVTIQWTAATDSFGHSITYSVHYSKDDGKSWITLATGLIGLTYTWDVTSLYHETKVLLKVQATDNIGFQSASISDEFNIDNPGLISTAPTTPPDTESTATSESTITPGFSTLLLLISLIPLLLKRKRRQTL